MSGSARDRPARQSFHRHLTRRTIRRSAGSSAKPSREGIPAARIERVGNASIAGARTLLLRRDRRAELETLCARLGIDRSEVLAIGDSMNDIEMLKWAGVGVLMGHASEEMRQYADVITGPIPGFGVAVTAMATAGDEPVIMLTARDDVIDRVAGLIMLALAIRLTLPL